VAIKEEGTLRAVNYSLITGTLARRLARRLVGVGEDVGQKRAGGR
jgi:hypothetical protein